MASSDRHCVTVGSRNKCLNVIADHVRQQMNRIFCLDDEGLFVQDLDESVQGSIHEDTVLVQVLRQPNLHLHEKQKLLQALSGINRYALCCCQILSLRELFAHPCFMKRRCPSVRDSKVRSFIEDDQVSQTPRWNEHLICVPRNLEAAVDRLDNNVGVRWNALAICSNQWPNWTSYQNLRGVGICVQCTLQHNFSLACARTTSHKQGVGLRSHIGIVACKTTPHCIHHLLLLWRPDSGRDFCASLGSPSSSWQFAFLRLSSLFEQRNSGINACAECKEKEREKQNRKKRKTKK